MLYPLHHMEAHNPGPQLFLDLSLVCPLPFPRGLHCLLHHHVFLIHYNLQVLEHPLQGVNISHTRSLLFKFGDDYYNCSYQFQYGNHVTVLH